MRLWTARLLGTANCFSADTTEHARAMFCKCLAMNLRLCFIRSPKALKRLDYFVICAVTGTKTAVGIYVLRTTSQKRHERLNLLSVAPLFLRSFATLFFSFWPIYSQQKTRKHSNIQDLFTTQNFKGLVICLLFFMFRREDNRPEVQRISLA